MSFARTPVLFLDIDGVLNSDAYFRSQRHKQVPRPPEDSPLPEKSRAIALRNIDGNAVRRLQYIITSTEAVVVLSSTWRYYHDLADVQSYLHHHGGRSIRVVDRTPFDQELEGPYAPYAVSARRGDLRAGTHPRGYEIDQWLSQNEPVRSYAILDDDDDMVAHDETRSREFAERFIRTNPSHGLQNPHADRTIRALRRQLR